MWSITPCSWTGRWQQLCRDVHTATLAWCLSTHTLQTMCSSLCPAVLISHSLSINLWKSSLQAPCWGCNVQSSVGVRVVKPEVRLWYVGLVNGDDISDAQLGSLTLKTVLQPSLCLLLLDYSCQICIVLWAGLGLCCWVGGGWLCLKAPAQLPHLEN